MGVKSSYVATLHESLVTFLDDLAEKSIRLFSDFYYNVHFHLYLYVYVYVYFYCYVYVYFYF